MYNGFKNYQTWNLMLWEGENLREMIKESGERDRYNIENMIKEFALENEPEAVNGFYGDILIDSIYNIDFYAISKMILEEIEEEEKEEDYKNE